MKITYDTNIIECDKNKHQINCNECQKITDHYVLSSIEQFGTTSVDEDIYWNCKNQTIQCVICKNISFRTVSICSERQSYDEKGESYYSEKVEVYG
ncbi:hypothetical protein [Photobacterium carnosum]|jgi:hypothetical protein|uniref:Uncharacterized protein n=1 Tax=Photobacterium carnosum TaxID=2023717 RepID=A0A2N4UVH3_9GAMM|nr:hypothetical protein [Photobacterium carnosum]KAE8177259.1 hypothetical protein CIT27_08125 [Photobacterium carnosum]MBY3787795.1 hypothetical protein [Photobacterium carnosum]MCD9494225.1 hypothetical protein [Photobacterium carnosum]MCD9514235.1 hypothetical protein [Photobacterium carnosum]MCD9525837.1 hypothetical protein [Photobacterium carnosum]